MNQCNDPDHGAINAERSESRGLRKAWVELDDKRQVLERELTAVTKKRDEARTQLALTEKTSKYQHGKPNKPCRIAPTNTLFLPCIGTRRRKPLNH